MNNEELQAHVKSGKPTKNLHYPEEMLNSKFMNEFAIVRNPARAILCADGFMVSIQASSSHYCSPRANDGPYSHFELGYPSEPDDLITEYAEDGERLTQTVYPMVPLQVVLDLVNRHGGVKPTQTQE